MEDCSEGQETVPIRCYSNGGVGEAPCWDMSYTYMPRPVLHESLSRTFLRACVATDVGCTCTGTCGDGSPSCECHCVSGGCAYTADGILQPRLVEEVCNYRIHFSSDEVRIIACILLLQFHSVFCDFALTFTTVNLGPIGALDLQFLKCRDGGNAHLVHCLGKFQCEGFKSGACAGHVQRTYIQECGGVCQCEPDCINRVVQKGPTKRFEVFIVSCHSALMLCPMCSLMFRKSSSSCTSLSQVYFVSASKGWGLRTVEPLCRGSFLFEYAGEVVTNAELFRRGHGSKYSILLDAHWQSEYSKTDKDLLCIDATEYTNLARWMNHR